VAAAANARAAAAAQQLQERFCHKMKMLAARGGFDLLHASCKRVDIFDEYNCLLVHKIS